MTLSVGEVRNISPTLGDDAVRVALIAGAVGVGLIFIFMGVMYRGLGLAADIALAVYILLLVWFCSVLPWVQLTLPGIAGILLSIGMAVDGNILIYERMKEELRAGKTTMAALDAGFRKALVVILDSNITTLIAAAILFYFGSGPIRGFAVTLSIGIVASVFCNVVVTRTLLGIALSARRKQTI